MKISLEEAFKLLEENEINPVSDKTEDNIEFNVTSDFGKTIKKPNPKFLEDLWDQVYCSLTDSADNRIYNLLGDWSGHRHYSPSHVTPSTTAGEFLPKGFKSKAGYNDIIVFSPQVDMTSGTLDVTARNKKNRGEDFTYAKDVANIYHLPYLELDNAFVLYIPKSKYLNAETLNLDKVLTLFTDEIIDTYLNNINQIEADGVFLYDPKAYLSNKTYNKAKNLEIAKNDSDMINWAFDTTDELFNDTFGIRQSDNDYTVKEEQIFDKLLDKVLDREMIIANKLGIETPKK